MPAESDIAGKHVMISYIFELETHLQTAVTWKEKTWICPRIDPPPSPSQPRTRLRAREAAPLELRAARGHDLDVAKSSN